MSTGLAVGGGAGPIFEVADLVKCHLAQGTCPDLEPRDGKGTYCTLRSRHYLNHYTVCLLSEIIDIHRQ